MAFAGASDHACESRMQKILWGVRPLSPQIAVILKSRLIKSDQLAAYPQEGQSRRQQTHLARRPGKRKCRVAIKEVGGNRRVWFGNGCLIGGICQSNVGHCMFPFHPHRRFPIYTLHWTCHHLAQEFTVCVRYSRALSWAE